MIKLYHGTNAFFEQPDLSKCRPFKDFGKGFYLTPDLTVAKRMAERCVERSDWQGAPKYVYVYTFDDADLSELNIRRFTSVVNEEFALFVMANRQMRSKMPDHNRDNRYDIVVGPIADDRMVLNAPAEGGEAVIWINTSRAVEKKSPDLEWFKTEFVPGDFYNKLTVTVEPNESETSRITEYNQDEGKDDRITISVGSFMIAITVNQAGKATDTTGE